MLQPPAIPATPLLERLRTGVGRRTLAIGLVVLIEGLLLLMLLTLGWEKHAGREETRISVVNLEAAAVPAEAAEQSSPEADRRAEDRPAPQTPAPEDPLPAPATDPLPSPPAEPAPSPPTQPAPPVSIPPPAIRLPPNDAPRNTARPAPSGRPVYGPPDRGRPAYLRDTERVGTAPNGEPLYAAAWYREPDQKALGDYLSTARGPGWGLIACRTASEYRVEDCVGLGEYPEGSQIMRAVLAAAWEFRVRPPRLGGQLMVGSWVRIRIDYGIKRR